MAHLTQHSTDRLTHPRLNLIEERLGRNLAAHIADRRRARTSWRVLAVELAELTGVEVSGEALRQWHNALPPADITAGSGPTHPGPARPSAPPPPKPAKGKRTAA